MPNVSAMSAADGRDPADPPSTYEDFSARALATARIAGAVGVVERLPTAALLVDDEGIVRAVNEAARLLCAGGVLVAEAGAPIEAATPMDQALIDSAIAAALIHGAQCLSLGEGCGPGTLFLSIARLAPKTQRNEDRRRAPTPAAVIVHLMQEYGASTSVQARLTSLYGLSEIEAQAALAVYRGDDFDAFAAGRGLDVVEAKALWESLTTRLDAHGAGDIVRRVTMILQISGGR
ncbi:hypothetical protein [Acuticoccus kandeliae]|uniref:hypothetical protein n=1 Tax=Acuticoccus kandeliae TaxID=2073160 RepID=UPI001300711C|nr:hypothetical protein [Acuticoccus kandeliae]